MALTNADATRNGFSSAVRDAWLSANHMPLFTQHSPILKMFQQQGRIKPAGYGVVMREPLMVPVVTGPQLEGVTNAYADDWYRRRARHDKGPQKAAAGRWADRVAGAVD